MKELSIEGKATRYDEVIEQLRAMMPNWENLSYNGKTFLQDLVYIFPELKESEDERISKHLLYHFQNKTKEEWNGMPVKDILAWIEEQEQHKKFRDSIQVGDKVTKNEDGVLVNLSQLSRVAKKDKKQGSEPNWCHHKVDLSNCSEEYRKAYYDGWNNCNMQHSQCKSELDDVVKCLINGMKFYCEDNEEATWGTDKWSMPVKHIIEVLEKQGEQKSAENEELTEFDKAVGVSIGTWNPKTPEQIQSVKAVSKKLLKLAKKQINDEQNPDWSEEDELMLTSIIQTLKLTNGAAQMKIDWLKSLKDRVQPKMEWSEDDSPYFDDICELLMNILHSESRNYNMEAIKKDLNWLKSLRPQNRWKPSDEQINCLSKYIEYERRWNSSHALNVLSELLEQLKKLREE